MSEEEDEEMIHMTPGRHSISAIAQLSGRSRKEIKNNAKKNYGARIEGDFISRKGLFPSPAVESVFKSAFTMLSALFSFASCLVGIANSPSDIPLVMLFLLCMQWAIAIALETVEAISQDVVTMIDKVLLLQLGPLVAASWYRMGTALGVYLTCITAGCLIALGLDQNNNLVLLLLVSALSCLAVMKQLAPS